MKREKDDNLDRLLSERLKSAVDHDRAANWLDVRRRGGESEAHVGWSRRRVVFVAAVLVLAVGACAGGTGVIPWINQKPAKSKYHPPKLAPACTAKDIKAELSLQGATQNLAGPITLTNIGRASCSLVGPPRISFTGSAANVERWKIERVPSPVNPSDSDVQTHRESLRAFEPGKQAVVYLFWGNWCGPGSAAGGFSGAGPTAFELTLGGGSRLIVPDRWGAPTCGDPSQPSFLQVSPFEPVIEEPPASTRLPLHATIVGKRTVRHDGSRFLLHRGKVFHYRVALTNTSNRAFRFGSCPSYLEGLALTGSASYLLNCRSVGTIASGETVLFTMEFRVPRNARLGNSGLSWLLAPHTNNSPSADASVLVVP